MKKVFALFVFAAGVALAEESMCFKLCEPCKDTPDEATCANVIEVCKCTAIFDSLDAERAAKEAEQARIEAEKARLEAERAELEARRTAWAEARKNALGSSLHDECLAGKCAMNIWFEGAELAAFEPGEAGFLPAEEPAFAPFQNECSGLCKLAETGDPASPMLAQIEASCSCKAHVQDSLKLEAFRAARLVNSNAAADSVVNACFDDEVCKVRLALEGTAFALADFVKQEKPEVDSTALLLASFREPRREALGNLLHEVCSEGKCTVRVSFEDAALKEMKTRKQEGTEAVPEPGVKELSSECSELCKLVAEDAESKMVAQIESTCGCALHVQDSFMLEEFRAARLANSNAAADSLVEFCAEQRSCHAELVLNDTTFALMSMANFEVPKPEVAAPADPKFDRLELILGAILSECRSATSASTCDIRFTFQGERLSFEAALNPSGDSAAKPLGLSAYLRKGNAALAANSVNEFCFDGTYCDVDVSLDGGTRALIFLRPHEGAFPFKEQPKRPEPAKERQKDRIFYKGISLYGAVFAAHYDDELYGLEYVWDGEYGMNFGLGFLLRWYFYKWGSFQTGLDVSYKYADLGDDHSYTSSSLWGISYRFGGGCGIKFHDISAEIPLQLRLGVPVLYATFLFNIRKPIWNYTEAYFEGSYWSSSSYKYLDEDESASAFRGVNVWSFGGYFGGGFELSRHFTIEALFGLFEVNTVDEYLAERMLIDDQLSLRVKMDIAW